MANEVERWKWLQAIASEAGPTDPTTRYVLMTLSLHMNQRGEHAFPSQRLLAKRTGLSERSVREHLRLARDAGWILVYAKQPKGHGWRLHEYAAAVPDRVAENLPESPWEADPTYERAEPVAARERGFNHEPEEGEERPAARSPAVEAPQSTERAANGAGRAATDDTTCGTSFHNVRNQLPLNPFIESFHRILSGECALTRTPLAEPGIQEGLPREGPSASPRTLRIKPRRSSLTDSAWLARMVEAGVSLDIIARNCGCTVSDVQQAVSGLPQGAARRSAI